MSELYCFGRAGVDLYAEQIGVPLEDVTSFAKYVGGCPANIAIGASRLGLKTGIISGVGAEPMGRFIRQTFEKEGVDTECLITKEAHLSALVILGIEPPDHFPLIFYRENCADMQLQLDDLPSLEGKTVLLSGTHCSTEQTWQLTKQICARAERLFLDLDYRPVLWGAAAGHDGEDRESPSELYRSRMEELIPLCELIFGTEEEFAAACGGRSKVEGRLVEKRGARGCLIDDWGREIACPSFEAEVLNVLGAGDAFASGFLRGYLRDEPLEVCGLMGNAAGSIVVGRHGCAPAMPTMEELEDRLAANVN